ncbi:hypothetical protein PMAYCL1PPCAC_16466, partial [Pristionchus mayeri]
FIVCASHYEVGRVVRSDLFLTTVTDKTFLCSIIFTLAGSIFSQMAMALERYRAFQNLSTYEHTSKQTGHWLNAAHLVTTFSVWTAHYLINCSGTISAHCTMVTKFGDIFFTLLAV